MNYIHARAEVKNPLDWHRLGRGESGLSSVRTGQAGGCIPASGRLTGRACSALGQVPGEKVNEAAC